MKVNRFDKAQLKRVQRLDNGFVKAPAILTRTGVFPYINKDGSIRRELRLPEEVFAQETIESAQLAPMTLDHPYKHKGTVTSKNVKELRVGSVANVRKDGEFLHADTIIEAAEAVAAMDSGQYQQISLGYKADLEVAPAGATYNGIPYDFIQRNIRVNHVALVPSGRAGPESRIYLDAEDAECVDMFEEPEMTVETKPEVVEAVVAPVAVENPELIKAVQRADAAEKEIVRLTEELAKANDPARLQAAVAARAGLETKVREVAPALDIAALSDVDVMKATVTHLDSEISLDGKSPEAIAAYFDSVLKYASKRNAVTEAAAAKPTTAETTHLDSANDARATYYKFMRGEK